MTDEELQRKKQEDLKKLEIEAHEESEFTKRMLSAYEDKDYEAHDII
jgi:hypothetical protein